MFLEPVDAETDCAMKCKPPIPEGGKKQPRFGRRLLAWRWIPAREPRDDGAGWLGRECWHLDLTTLARSELLNAANPDYLVRRRVPAGALISVALWNLVPCFFVFFLGLFFLPDEARGPPAGVIGSAVRSRGASASDGGAFHWLSTPQEAEKHKTAGSRRSSQASPVACSGFPSDRWHQNTSF